MSSVTHDQVRVVVCHSPTVVRVIKLLQHLKSLRVISKSNFIPPGKLIDLVFEDRYPFTEKFRCHVEFLLHLSRFEIYPAQGRLPFFTGALIKKSVVKK